MIVTLVPITLAVFYTAYIASQSLAALEPMTLIIFLGSVATLAYIISTIKTMVGNEPVSRMVIVLGILFGVVGYAGLALLAYGAYQDATGMYCTGFFGSKASCTLGPVLILLVLFHHPIVMGIMGLLAITAMFLQVKIASKGSAPSKKEKES